MKVMVLGATGMLGAYSALALFAAGHKVVAVARRKDDNGFFQIHGIDYVGGWTLEDASSFQLLPTDIDAVVNMAGRMPAHGDLAPMPYVSSIVVGTVNLCEWLRKKTKCRRIVFNTTPADVSAYAGGCVPVPDDAFRTFPRNGGDHSVYAICKMAATDILEYYHIAYGFRPCVFRHMTVFGWHPNADYNVNGVTTVSPWRQIMRRCMRGLPIEIWGNPNRRSELLYIDDFTAAVCRAVESVASGIFNLPGCRPYTLEEEFQTLIDVFCPHGQESVKVYLPDKEVGPEMLLSGRKVEHELNWRATTLWEVACKRIRVEMQHNRFEKLWGAVSSEDQYL